MYLFFKRIFLLGIILGSLPAMVYGQQNVSLKYDIKVNGLSLGEATHTLKFTGNQYTITDVEKATGIIGLFTNQITRKSQGTVVNQQFKPTTYAELAKNKNRTTKLDWATKTATFTAQPDKVDHFDDNTVDRITFPFQYYLTQKAPPTSVYKQMLADTKRVEEQIFKTIGKETIDTPMGNMETIRVERAGDSKNMKMWLSPAHDYLPVRVIFIDKKENVFDQQIVEIVKSK